MRNQILLENSLSGFREVSGQFQPTLPGHWCLPTTPNQLHFNVVPRRFSPGRLSGASTPRSSGNLRIPLRAEPEVVDVEATALVKLEEDIEAGPAWKT